VKQPVGEPREHYDAGQGIRGDDALHTNGGGNHGCDDEANVLRVKLIDGCGIEIMGYGESSCRIVGVA
jgi:hypothetical protein